VSFFFFDEVSFFLKAAQVSLKSCAAFAQLHVRFYSKAAVVLLNSCAGFTQKPRGFSVKVSFEGLVFDFFILLKRCCSEE
jgi:hypothetical protein